VGSRVRAVCIHGHYYQPPREHPWLGVVEPEPSAAPDPDWNVRILRECYAPNAAARLLDAHGRLRGLISNYAWTSFNVGPTLDAWFVRHAPALILLDVGRPGICGAELIERVCESDLVTMPIVAMTTDPCDAARLLAPRVTECLAKPFDLDELLACVARHVRPAQAVDQRLVPCTT